MLAYIFSHFFNTFFQITSRFNNTQIEISRHRRKQASVSFRSSKKIEDRMDSILFVWNMDGTACTIEQLWELLPIPVL